MHIIGTKSIQSIYLYRLIFITHHRSTHGIDSREKYENYYEDATAISNGIIPWYNLLVGLARTEDVFIL